MPGSQAARNTMWRSLYMTWRHSMVNLCSAPVSQTGVIKDSTATTITFKLFAAKNSISVLFVQVTELLCYAPPPLFYFLYFRKLSPEDSNPWPLGDLCQRRSSKEIDQNPLTSHDDDSGTKMADCVAVINYSEDSVKFKIKKSRWRRINRRLSLRAYRPLSCVHYSYSCLLRVDRCYRQRNADALNSSCC